MRRAGKNEGLFGGIICHQLYHKMPPKFDGIQVSVCFCHFEKVIKGKFDGFSLYPAILRFHMSNLATLTPSNFCLATPCGASSQHPAFEPSLSLGVAQYYYATEEWVSRSIAISCRMPRRT